MVTTTKLHYRGTAVPTVIGNADTHTGTPLHNDEIDQNFYSLAFEIDNRVSTTATIASNRGGTGFTTYTKGDIIYASADNTLEKLSRGASADGSVLKLSGGVPIWGVDNTVVPGSGSFGVSIGTAGGTNTTVTWGTATGFNANTSTNAEYDLKVGPALTNLAAIMTTAGAGFIKRGATADNYTIDTSTYSLSDHNHANYIVKFDTGITEGTDLYTYNGSAAKTIDIKAGTNVSLTKAANTITINSSYTDTDTITRLRGTASGTYTSGDLTLVAGNNVTISQTGTNYTINSSYTNTNTTYYLDGQGTTNDVDIQLISAGDGAGVTDSIKMVGTGATTVSWDEAAQKITINSTDNNTDILQSIIADAADAERYITFVNSASGAQTGGSSIGLLFNPSTKTLTIGGDLIVNGTTTTINSTTLTVDDKNIELGHVTTPTNATADGGGITLLGGTDGNKTFNWVNATGAWTSNVSLSAPLLISTASQGTSPLIVSSTTLVSNLNADLLDGQHGSYYYSSGNPPPYPPDTNTTYNHLAVTTTGGALLRLNASTGVNDDVKFASGTNVTVAYTDDNTITISSIDTNTTYDHLAVNVTGGASLRLHGSNGSNDDVKFASGNAITVAYTNDDTITINHNDTSSVTDVDNSGNTFIQDLTFDTYGHVLTVNSGTVDFSGSNNYAFAYVNIATDTGFTWGAVNTNVTQAADSSLDTLTVVKGGGINLYANTVAAVDAIKIEHADTSNVANVNNSGNTFIQDLTFDEYGHVTAVVSGTVTDANTTYDHLAVTATGGAFLRLHGSDNSTDDVKFASGTNVTVSYTDANTITISSTDTDTLQSVTDDTTTNATYYPHFVTATSGALTAKVSSTKLTFNPSTGTLLAANLNVPGFITVGGVDTTPYTDLVDNNAIDTYDATAYNTIRGNGAWSPASIIATANWSNSTPKFNIRLYEGSAVDALAIVTGNPTRVGDTFGIGNFDTAEKLSTGIGVYGNVVSLIAGGTELLVVERTTSSVNKIYLPTVGSSGLVRLNASGLLSADTTTYATGTGTATGTNTGDQVIPTTLPASDVYAWAKAASKPSYTAAEVGAQVAGSYESPLTFSNGVSRSVNAISISYGTSLNTVCQGNDSRLSDSRSASDVYPWAKAVNKPSYNHGEIGSGAITCTTITASGAITSTGDITAFSPSDRNLKENIQDIPNALDKVDAIGGKTFDWTDAHIASRGGADGYFVVKSDFGVIAQDVQSVFPVATRTRDDGTLAVDYEKLCALAFAAIKELRVEIELLKGTK